MQISDINIKLNAKDDFKILLDLSMSNNLNCIRNNRKSYPRPWKGRQHSLDDARARIIALLTALLDDIMSLTGCAVLLVVVQRKYFCWWERCLEKFPTPNITIQYL